MGMYDELLTRREIILNSTQKIDTEKATKKELTLTEKLKTVVIYSKVFER